MQTSFTVNAKELKSAFRRLFGFRKRTNSLIFTIVVEPEAIELKVPGITQRVKAKGEGMADVVMPAEILHGYLQTVTAATIAFVFTPGQLECGSSIRTHAGITVTPSPVERLADEVPFNLNPGTILRFAAGRTPEELKAMNLTSKVQYARIKLREAVAKAAELLREYDVQYEDLMAIFEQKGLIREKAKK